MCRSIVRSIGRFLGLSAPRMPSLPPPPAPPAAPPAPPPVPSVAQADEAGDKARRAARLQGGRATTILTGAQGLVGTEAIARPTATKVLLGG